MLAGCADSVPVPGPRCEITQPDRIGRIFLAWEGGDPRCPLFIDSTTDESAHSLVPVFCEGSATECSAEYTCDGQIGGPIREPSEFDVELSLDTAHVRVRLLDSDTIYCEADYSVEIQSVHASGGLNEPGLNALAWPSP
jgi:hypothetical protein